MSTYIIFDLDETLGHFTQLGILWESIQHVYRKEFKPDPILTAYVTYIPTF